MVMTIAIAIGGVMYRHTLTFEVKTLSAGVTIDHIKVNSKNKKLTPDEYDKAVEEIKKRVRGKSLECNVNARVINVETKNI